ncbi:MAG: 2-oxoacid:acceptor oxidoreductase family protein [Spirochaetota bacterium]
MFKSIFITGLGGQGIVTFARLITEHASEQGFKVSLFNSKGMAQRGGRVTSEIRLASDHAFQYGSRISADGADILVGMEIGEAVNSFSFLKEGGLAVLLNYAFVPAPMILKKEAYPSFEQVLEIFSQKTDHLFGVADPQNPYNIFLLGVFGSILKRRPDVLPGFTCEGLKKTISRSMQRNLETNLKVFQQGSTFEW